MKNKKSEPKHLNKIMGKDNDKPDSMDPDEIGNIEETVKYKKTVRRLNEDSNTTQSKYKIDILKQKYEECKTDECRKAVKKEIRNFRLKQAAILGIGFPAGVFAATGLARYGLKKFSPKVDYSHKFDNDYEKERKIPTINPNPNTFNTQMLDYHNSKERRQNINKKIQEYRENNLKKSKSK